MSLVVFISSFEVKEILKRADLEDAAGTCGGFEQSRSGYSENVVRCRHQKHMVFLLLSLLHMMFGSRNEFGVWVSPQISTCVSRVGHHSPISEHPKSKIPLAGWCYKNLFNPTVEIPHKSKGWLKTNVSPTGHPFRRGFDLFPHGWQAT